MDQEGEMPLGSRMYSLQVSGRRSCEVLGGEGGVESGLVSWRDDFVVKTEDCSHRDLSSVSNTQAPITPAPGNLTTHTITRPHAHIPTWKHVIEK